MALALASRSPNKALAAETRAAKRKASRTPPGMLTVPGASAFAPRAAGSPAPTIQAKLEIGSPNDRFEREAERVADQVMGMPHTPTFVAAPLPGHAGRSVQRMCDECSEEDKP